MNKIDFNNSQIAFEAKTDKELNKAVFLFKILKSGFLVKIGSFFTKFALAIRFPIGWAVRPTIYQHFVGGEKLENCNKIIEKHSKFNVKIILDYSVEGGDTEPKINAALAETLKTIDNAASNHNIPFAVFKPTAFCFPHILEKAGNNLQLNEIEQKELDNFFNRVNILCERAFEKNIPIMIDAEDVAYQNHIDKVVFEMMLLYNKQKAIVYNTLQMYRKDRLDFLKNLLKKATEDNIKIGVKFVRGAYMEKERELAKKLNYPDPIHNTKQDTDNAFNEALRISVENIDKISIFNATHNEFSTQHFVDLINEYKINKNDERCYFSQLYGMSDNITFNLAKNGYNATKYTPYGPIKQVIPYLIRRAQENTAVKGSTSRELNLFLSEKKRRKDNN